MQNWDEEFNEIMQRRLKQYKEKRNNIETNYNLNKENYPNIPIILTDYNFTGSVNKYHFLIVDFWAAWCGPCRTISPIIEQLSNEFSGKAVFGKLNVDENPRISNAFEIQSIPTIIIFKNGQAIDRIIGTMIKSQLVLKISNHIKGSSDGRFNDS
ncbi:MAG: thioredoxin [Thermoproteota archaeon]|nr:thioredoxin [Thermoproteota archaeon]